MNRQQRRRWDDYVAEAKVTPFELEKKDGSVIKIEQPTSNTIIAMDRTDDLEEVIRLICGDAADEVFELIGDAPFAAYKRLQDDLVEHFNVPKGEAKASSS